MTTLTRWVDEEMAGLEGRAGALLRQAREVRLPPPPPLSAVLSGPRPRRRLSRGLALAVLLPVGALAGLIVTGLRGHTQQGLTQSGPGPADQEAAVEPGPLPTRVEPPSPVAPPQQTAAPAGPPAAMSSRASAPGAARPASSLRPAGRSPGAPLVSAGVEAASAAEARSSAGEPPPQTATLAEEARLMGEALDGLKAGAPARAIAALSQYRERFPRGVLSFEAVLAEVRAHRALRQPNDALVALDRAAEGPAAARVELQVLRGELLAERGDCGAALAPLDAALAGPLAPAYEERAVAARAECSAARAEPEATGWLERYLSRWPRGPFAARARALWEARTGPEPEGER